MSGQLVAERESLEKKEKDELRQIVAAMGGKSSPRVRKADLIDQILVLSGVASPEDDKQAEEKKSESNSKTSNKPKPENERATSNKSQDSNNANENGNTPNNNNSSNNNGDDRGRNRGRGSKNGRVKDREEAGFDPISSEPETVTGYLDLRDEGYGFLRVSGFLPSREDVYVSVKQVRQLGLRKGDRLSGLAVPAHRHEKNPCFQEIASVNGIPVSEMETRPKFEEMTPIFPNERLVMERPDEPLNMTTRIIDLVTPIGKGQRAMIVAPPKAGKTAVIKEISASIETNHPDVTLMVLLVDERPEEVTDMARHLKDGEVVASTFDRPADEHIAIAELTVERAKRLVEQGEDVCLILDGITRLTRAYNTAAANTGRTLTGGLDMGALYPPKKFFGAARNIEEGGSLTIIATALIETGSKMDDVIFEEFKGTGNSELRLDRRIADRRVYPAVNIKESSTRNDELLTDRKTVEATWSLRKVVAGLENNDENPAAGIEMLVDRLKQFKKNADFLAEVGKSRSV